MRLTNKKREINTLSKLKMELQDGEYNLIENKNITKQ